MTSFDELLKSLKRSFQHHFITQIATLLVVAGVFCLISFSLLVTINLNTILGKWGTSTDVTVFLKDEVNEELAKKLKASIEKEPNISPVKHISKEQAFKEFSNQLSTYAPKMLKDNEFQSSLPSSFQFSFLNQQNLTEIVGLAQRINQLDGVEEVSYGQGWIENYAAFITGLSRLTYAAIVILGLGSLLIIANSLRASIHQRREEIEILELVGATYSSIRWPFLFEGAFLGTISALFALAGNYGIFILVRDFLNSDFSFMGIANLWHFISIPTMALVVFGGATLGMGGAYLCIRKINDGWAARG